MCLSSPHSGLTVPDRYLSFYLHVRGKHQRSNDEPNSFEPLHNSYPPRTHYHLTDRIDSLFVNSSLAHHLTSHSQQVLGVLISLVWAFRGFVPLPAPVILTKAVVNITREFSSPRVRAKAVVTKPIDSSMQAALGPECLLRQCDQGLEVLNSVTQWTHRHMLC